MRMWIGVGVVGPPLARDTVTTMWPLLPLEKRL